MNSTYIQMSAKIKNCFISSCLNTTGNCKKVFVTVPKGKNRQKWFNALNAKITLGNRYCCEDHFNLEQDAKNWMYWKTMGGSVFLKGDVPHLNLGTIHLDQPSPVGENRPSKSTETKFSTPSGEFISVVEECGSSPWKGHGKLLDVKNNLFSEAPGTSQYIFSADSKLAVSSFDSQSSLSTSTIKISDFGSPSSSTSGGVGTYQKPTEVLLKEFSALLETRSRFYLGLPQDVYYVVNLCLNEAKVRQLDVLVVLKKIRLDDENSRLADDFQLTQQAIGNIFRNTIVKLAMLFQQLVFWLEKKTCKRLLPIAFRLRYQNISSIIDCFEIEIQKPSNPLNQALTWSDYKNCNNLKYLISCTPHGFINFISNAFGGRTSDKVIVEESTYLNNLPNGESVMADRGFKHVANLLSRKNCILVRPPSVATGENLSKEDANVNKQIASLRINVERIIGRLREFKMLAPHACINHNLLHLMDCVVTIACGIVNLHGPIYN